MQTIESLQALLADKELELAEATSQLSALRARDNIGMSREEYHKAKKALEENETLKIHLASERQAKIERGEMFCELQDQNDQLRTQLAAAQSSPTTREGEERLREALEKIHALLPAMPGRDGSADGVDVWRLWTDALNIAKSALSTPATDVGGDLDCSHCGGSGVLAEPNKWGEPCNERQCDNCNGTGKLARPSGEPSDPWKEGYMARLNEETVERPEPKHPTLWRYLDNAHKLKITFHRIGVNRQADGGYHFYIHPEGVSGDTQDYLLWPDPFTWEDMLVNRLESPQPDAEGFKRALRLAMSHASPPPTDTKGGV